ncbi:MAG: hypothetical protein WC838_00150 [Candidatus Margulisiibacteriota bacterium]|jgi:hypothetical protein
MTEQELETILATMVEKKVQGKIKFLEFHMDFEVVSIDVLMGLN